MSGESGRLVRVLKADNQGHVEAVSWSPDGRWLASASFNERVFGSGTRRQARSEGGSRGIRDEFKSVSWSPDGRLAGLGVSVTRSFGSGTRRRARSGGGSRGTRSRLVGVVVTGWPLAGLGVW